MKHNLLLEKINNFYKIATPEQIPEKLLDSVIRSLDELIYQLKIIPSEEIEDLIKSLNVYKENINFNMMKNFRKNNEYVKKNVDFIKYELRTAKGNLPALITNQYELQTILRTIDTCLKKIEDIKWEGWKHFPEYDPSKYVKEEDRTSPIPGLKNLKYYINTPSAGYGYQNNPGIRERWNEVIDENLKKEMQNPTKLFPIGDPRTLEQHKRNREKDMAELIKEWEERKK